MAYATANLSLMLEGIGGTTPQLWFYSSADAIATVRAANYISDAQARGMKARDIVIVFDTNTPTTSLCTALTVASTGADLTDGTALSETNS